MYTTINYNEIGVKYSQEFEDGLDDVRSKTGLGYIMSKFKPYEQPKSIDSTKITEKLTREVQETYRAITGADKYKPYFERRHPDVGSEDFVQTRDLQAEERFNRNAMVNQILRIPTCTLQRSELEALSMDRLIRLTEKVGERA